MKLPKLPALKRKTPTTGVKRVSSVKGLGSTIRKRPLRANKGGAPQFSTVDRKKDGFGGDVWFETDCAATDKAAVGGICAKCGEAVRAIDLRLRRTKDGDEYWKCIWC